MEKREQNINLMKYSISSREIDIDMSAVTAGGSVQTREARRI